MTASQSERRLATSDYYPLQAAFNHRLRKLKASGSKIWFNYVEVDKYLRYLYSLEHAYIVDGYLIAYEIQSPPYTSQLFLTEIIVFNLAGKDFGVAPAFLERKAREAGCALVGAGTALARNDAALASLYHQHGFKTETHLLIKEL